ncbi:hypothetical protein BBJ28_00016565 [Nothophytophthora sp. Chile5]|nr:hypothetical protein BBJ28_00016565 [Nothophytophthora sp. Chile5]
MGRRRSARADDDAAARQDLTAPPAQPQMQTQPQLPWGMEKTEMQPSSLTALTDDKLARFVLGHQKKTKFQKEREDREAKKRQADAEAAQIYATFGNRAGRSGTSVSPSGRQTGDVYRLKPKESAPFSAFSDTSAAASFSTRPGKKVSEMDRMMEEIKQNDIERTQHREQFQLTQQQPKKRRAIDEFMEEMKERGPEPPPLEGVGSGLKGSFDNGDPETTNLYVGNLAPTVTEEVLQPMVVGWGKAVKIEPRSRAPGLLLSSAVLPTPVVPPAVMSATDVDLAGKKTITVEVPTDETMRRRIDRLAQYVATDGLQFENAIRLRESGNMAEYAFLLETQSALALYYRWRVYSFAMGDDEYSWREKPFQMAADGPVSRDSRRPGVRDQDQTEKAEKLLTGQQIARARDLERGHERNRLSSEDYDDFKELLDGLTLERESVKKTMGFALDNSEAAVDLVHVILKAFQSSKASAVTLVGLLYVTSDILHNSSAAVKNASLFRTTFEECLPEIMDALRVTHKAIAGRMSANAMKEKVLNVLTAWESWSLFPPGVLVGLHATFLRKVEEDEYIATKAQELEGVGDADLERLRKTCRQAGILAKGDARQLLARLKWLQEFTSTTPATTAGHPAVVKKAIVQTKTTFTAEKTLVLESRTTERKIGDLEEGDLGEEDLDGAPIDEEDLDGDPIDEEPNDDDDVDGEPMDGAALDGEPMDGEALDGEPLGGNVETTDDVDGEPLDDDDMDGVPLDEDDLDGEPI